MIREQPIKGLMPMSDVPMLAWSNRPIPIPIPIPMLMLRPHAVHTCVLSIFICIANAACVMYDRLETNTNTNTSNISTVPKSGTKTVFRY